MSSLLRAASVAVLENRRSDLGLVSSRVFGTRLMRGDSVGLQQPIPLLAPLLPHLDGDPLFGDHDQPPAPAPLDVAVIEEAARLAGYGNGFEAGHAAGLAAAAETMAGEIRRLAAVVSGIHENHAAFFRSAERQVVDLALQIAQKVVEREIENMPDLAVNVIRAALEEMDGRTAVRVRVNPADEELLRRRWAQVVPQGIGADRVELQQDDRVQSGGAIIETTHGQVDAQLDTKLAQLGNALWTFVMDVSTAQDQDDASA